MKPAAKGPLLLGAGLLATAALSGGAWWAWKAFRTAPTKPAAPAEARAPEKPDAPAEMPPKTEAPAWATAAGCPERTIAFVGLRNLPDLAARVQKTDLCAVLLEAVRDFGQGAPPEMASWTRMLSSMDLFGRLLRASDGETALALTELEHLPNYRPVPHLLLLVRPASPCDLEALGEQAFAALAKDAPHLKRTEHDHAGTKVRLIGDADVTFGYAVHEGILLMASHESTLLESLDRLSARGRSLGDSTAFRDLAAAATARDVLGFLNPDPLWDDLDERDEHRVKALGLRAIDGVCLSLEVAPPGFVERLSVHTSGPRAGILALLDNPPVEHLEALRLPPGTFSFSRTELAPPAEAFEQLTKTLQATLEPADYSAFQGFLEQFRTSCGFDLKSELLKSLGTTVVSTWSPGADPAHPDAVYVVGLDNPTLLSACIEKSLLTAARSGARPFARQWLEGSELFLVQPQGWNACMPLPVPPEAPPIAFGLPGGSLVVATRPELVTRKRLDANQPVPEEILAALKALPKDCWSLSYTDVNRLLASLNETIPAPDRQALPSCVRTLLEGRRNLPPILVGAASAPRTFLIEIRGPLPVLTAAFGAGVTLPFLVSRAQAATQP